MIIDGSEDGGVLHKGLSVVCTGAGRISIGLDNRVHYDRDNPHDDGIFCRLSDAAVKLELGSHTPFMSANDVFHLLNVLSDSTNIRWSSSLGGQAGNSRFDQKAHLDQGEMQIIVNEKIQTEWITGNTRCLGNESALSAQYLNDVLRD